jgi:hypothetical protein
VQRTLGRWVGKERIELPLQHRQRQRIEANVMNQQHQCAAMRTEAQVDQAQQRPLFQIELMPLAFFDARGNGVAGVLGRQVAKLPGYFHRRGNVLDDVAADHSEGGTQRSMALDHMPDRRPCLRIIQPGSEGAAVDQIVERAIPSNPAMQPNPFLLGRCFCFQRFPTRRTAGDHPLGNLEHLLELPCSCALLRPINRHAAR